ncbi:GNAT family N-acetyltransferase [Alteromonas oceanisediminis]|uniref:GNAT family N-acetyltransferase n=1 Tax=Alteromonas oceanisediminis TaxID=2836180 RepID=UPI001BDA3E3F|nr:GNAT family N-acetyltransferase [Alteromonas oceanisediminis]MBT0584948.1 GNAT family N-acetyltransferase [Alteromonas oceanisediminis]
MDSVMPSRLCGYQVTLISVTEAHLEQLRAWRNSAHVKQYMLTQDNITPEQQLAWFAHVSRATNQHHYLIEYRDRLIGSCNLKTRGNASHIAQADHFELGLYIGDADYMGNLIAFAPTLVLNDFCFNALKAACLHAVVKPENQAAMRYNQQLGYVVVKSDGVVELSLTQERYEGCSKPLKQLLSRQRKTTAQ